jgi:hypothetical protein
VPGLPSFWNAIVPVMVGLVLCGDQVILFPETQYEYGAVSSTVTTLPEVL